MNRPGKQVSDWPVFAQGDAVTGEGGAKGAPEHVAPEKVFTSKPDAVHVTEIENAPPFWGVHPS